MEREIPILWRALLLVPCCLLAYPLLFLLLTSLSIVNAPEIRSMTTDTPQLAEKSKLRWYQYRLVHLFVLMTLVAISCALWCKKQEANKRKEAVEAIHRLGGLVVHDYQVDAKDDPYLIHNAEPPGPEWLRNLVGVEFLADVVEVRLNDTQVSDAGLVYLKRFTNLEELNANL